MISPRPFSRIILISFVFLISGCATSVDLHQTPEGIAAEKTKSEAEKSRLKREAVRKYIGCDVYCEATLAKIIVLGEQLDRKKISRREYEALVEEALANGEMMQQTAMEARSSRYRSLTCTSSGNRISCD